MAPSQSYFNMRTVGIVAHWGVKVFPILKACYGDFSGVVEIVEELLNHGPIAQVVADPKMWIEALDNVFNLHDGIKGFRASITNFSQFCRALSRQLALGGNKTDSTTMVTVDRHYNTFKECDRDRSGGVSLEEFIIFCSKEGVPASMAETMFSQADTDGNGEISFEEWAAMMNARVGRDPKSFNCGGHHGLTVYTAPCNGMICDFCEAPILAGSQVSGCRRCDCDACAKCSGLEVPSPGSLNCGGGHGLTLFSLTAPMECDWCTRYVDAGNVAAGCRTCNCDACTECIAVDLASNSSGLLTCPGRHGLALTRTSVPGYVCDFCGGGVATGVSIFSCRLCQVDACLPCMWYDHGKVLKSGGAFSCNGNHSLQTINIMHYGQLQTHKCSWCRGSPTLGERMLWCNICSVSVCSACLASNPTRAAPSRRPPPPSYHESLHL